MKKKFETPTIQVVKTEFNNILLTTSLWNGGEAEASDGGSARIRGSVASGTTGKKVTNFIEWD